MISDCSSIIAKKRPASSIDWRAIQRENFRDIKQLASFLKIPLEAFPLSLAFPLNLPKRLAEKIEKGNIDDPILRQFVPLQSNQEEGKRFVKDPVGDQAFCKEEKLLQKYRGRALLLTTGACAMHCRYCFRQHFPYSKKALFAEEIELIKKDPSLKEIILSGGDPLSLGDEALGRLLFALESISHVEIIRFHTRFLIGIPERIDSSLLSLLHRCTKSLIFVIHMNHPKEFDDEVRKAVERLRFLGIPLLAQTVLLKGINDDLDTLKDLSFALVKEGILPYYLHQLDRVEGASHFEVEVEKGKKLIELLRAEVPGYALFRFVAEIPGQSSKTPL